jgi:hypothetical protein
MSPTPRNHRALPLSRLRVEQLEPRALLSATGFAQPAGLFVLPSYWQGYPTWYSPSQLQTAYGFNNIAFLSGKNYNTTAGAGVTVAIVDAFNDPTVLQDANVFSQQFGLPQFNSGAGTPTLTVVNQAGGSALPATDPGWAQEISLDVQWVHAIAPAANIVLVEAADNSTANMYAADAYAGTIASVVSNSWGGPGSPTEASNDGTFTAPHVTYVFSAGDSPTVEYPSASPNVLSVGGTTLFLNSSGGYGFESAWGSTGGGQSRYEPRTAAQSNFLNGGGLASASWEALASGKRLTPDVAYDANPYTGVPVYDSTPNYGQSGWMVFGGTSAGAPQWSALIALADQQRLAQGQSTLSTAQVLNTIYNPSTYASNFHDVTTGGPWGLWAGPGYDLSTGLGSPVASNLVANLAGGTPPVTHITFTIGTGRVEKFAHNRSAVQAAAVTTGAALAETARVFETAVAATFSGPVALPLAGELNSLPAGSPQEPPVLSGAVMLLGNATPAGDVSDTDTASGYDLTPVQDQPPNGTPQATPETPAEPGGAVPWDEDRGPLFEPETERPGDSRHDELLPLLTAPCVSLEQASLLIALALALGGYWRQPADGRDDTR